MKHLTKVVASCLLVGACTTPEQATQSRLVCESYGYEPGTPELAKCAEGKSTEGEAVFNQIGSQVLTSVILGAL